MAVVVYEVCILLGYLGSADYAHGSTELIASFTVTSETFLITLSPVHRLC
jgi:hypothetical protein